jgi:hypothetical protein
MRLDEIFTLRGYDMVVAVKMSAINDQIKSLCNEGIIKTR